MVPKVDTFEVDIAEEIRRKEASMTAITAASNNVGNNDDIILPKRAPVFLIVVIVFFVLCLLGFAGLGYYYFHDSILSPKPQDTVINPADVPKVTADINSLSATLSGQIGRFITRVEKKDQGYILTISEYSPVFAYMTRNEKDYIEELSLLFPATQVATTTPVIPVVETPVIPSPVVATSTASSTEKTATTTPKKVVAKTVAKKASTPLKTSTSTTPATAGTELSTTTQAFIKLPETNGGDARFADVTISNQNMRVWTGAAHTVVYAFVGSNTVLISNSTAGILALKGAILH